MKITLAVISMLAFTQAVYAAAPTAMNQIMAYKADQLIGVPVWSNGGEEVGRVKNIIIDEDGRVTLVILHQTGDENFGREREVAVPFKALRFSRVRPQATAVFLNASKEKLSLAPNYEPTLETLPEERVADIYRYFGQSPYWTENAK